MWITFALLSAFFTGSIAVIVKHGQRDTPLNIALALRFGVTVVLCALLLFAGYGREAFGGDSQGKTSLADTLLLLISGAFMCASQLYYYKALRQGSVALAVSLEKLTVPLTLIGGALFFDEKIEIIGWFSFALILLGILTGADLKGSLVKNRSDKQNDARTHRAKVLFYGSFSALCGSASVLLAKSAMDSFDSVSALALRGAFVLVISLVAAKKKGELKRLFHMDREQWFFALGVGLISAVAYLCSFFALGMAQAGRSHSVEKLSAAFALLISRFVLGEKLKRREAAGAYLMCAGVLLPLLMQNP